MADITRLAVLDRGEPAVRVLAAAGIINRERQGTPIVTVLVHSEPTAWYAREADLSIRVGEEVWREGNLDIHRLVAVLRAAKVDAIHLGWAEVDRAGVLEACEQAGICVVGPSAAIIRRVASPAGFAEVAAEAGVPTKALAGEVRLVEVDVWSDAKGRSRALGTREVTISLDGQRLISESPAAGIGADLEAEFRVAAESLGQSLGAVGVVGTRFEMNAAGTQFRAVGIDTMARPLYALREELTGTSLVGLRLLLAEGRDLPEPPESSGYVIGARVLCEDPTGSLAPRSGTVAMLNLPGATGVRIDATRRHGDLVDPKGDELLATVTAWGRTRAEALGRLSRALERTTAVIEGSATNRCTLLSVLNQSEFAAGGVTSGWVEEARRGGRLRPTPDALVVLVAAVEAYEVDFSLARGAFLASAARGRPEQPEPVGDRIQLAYRGVDYSLRVDCTAPDHFRVHDALVTAELSVERLNQFERRVICGGRRHRVVAWSEYESLYLEIDGTRHRVTREEGMTVRAGWPALVVAVLVEPGDEVSAGQPVAVLESMKMETTVTAPFAGVVTSVLVLPNVQIEAGAPLLRVRGAELAELTTGGTVPPSLDLSTFSPRPDFTQKPCEGVYTPLGYYLLGYDLDPAGIKRLLTMQHRLAEVADAGDGDLLQCEDGLLDLYSDLGALYRPRVEADDKNGLLLTGADSTQEYLIAFLQWRDADRAGLPDSYRERLLNALERYGVSSLDRSAALETAMVWMFRSLGRIRELAPVVLAILERRLTYGDALVHRADSTMRARLLRLAAATNGRQTAVAELARQTLFQFFDQPVLEQVVSESDAEMSGHLAALLDHPSAQDRDDRIERMVRSPHTLRAMLLDSWRQSGQHEEAEKAEKFREVLLEVYLRRYYRVREVKNLKQRRAGDFQFATLDYCHKGESIQAVTSYLELDKLPEFVAAIGGYLGSLPEDHQLVVDAVAWRDAPRSDLENLACLVTDLLRRCRFEHAVARFDITVTSTVGENPEHFRTQHVSFCQNPGTGEWQEDAVYRNQHPMLTKRLEFWRLSGFNLQRLPSPEDVYLYNGVAKKNPKDRRLFALAEVRDLTRMRDEYTGLFTYPWLQRVGLQALNAMRAALGGFSPKERPTSNRLVLVVRPIWDLPREEWLRLATTLGPMAKAAGVEKVVLKVRLPDETNPDRTRDAVLHVEGLGGGVTIRVDEPGTQPIAPLSEYRQKVMRAERFGVPYPYEIVRMLTAPSGSAADFPPGRFQELDLDNDSVLVPVHRQPGKNRSNIVVGLLTNEDPNIEEGMTRVAMLSDPTRGLGNLAEPECRRINAALTYAAERKLPVEWYAVSSGALIAMDSGTENMDWIALTLRRIIEFTQGGGEVNIIVTGINVGGQPYWNGEATMLMHTKGVLIMTPNSAMVLTGKQALDFSGGVSADDNFGIGGFDRVMGLNGQGQYWASSFADACKLLLQHYRYTYVVPGERYPRRRPTTDVANRDVRSSPHPSVMGNGFTCVGDVFSTEKNPDRKQPFDMRSVMAAVADTDAESLERWQHWKDAENIIVWDTTVGGIPVEMIGMESKTTVRKGFVPADGPPSWTSGTLFPQASRKCARAINAASGNRPLVVLANLSGFDGSPESMRNWQLEYGAEIGRAVTNFVGPIVFVVVSRYHGGAFVVFSKALNERMEIAAVEGSYASVIGGAPAAATVFARDVKQRTEKDSRVLDSREALACAHGAEAGALGAKLAWVTEAVRSEKLGEVADEFDSIHTIERALRVGSVDRIVAAAELRPWIIDALERGMAAEFEGDAAQRDHP